MYYLKQPDYKTSDGWVYVYRPLSEDYESAVDFAKELIEYETSEYGNNPFCREPYYVIPFSEVPLEHFVESFKSSYTHFKWTRDNLRAKLQELGYEGL